MTLRQIVSDLRAMIKQISGDALLTDRLLASELRSAAALLIRRDMLQRRLWNTPTIFTQVKCLQLCEVPLAECCSYRSPCTIRRSQCRIKGIADLGTFGLAIQGVFSIDGSRKFKEASPARYENILRLNIVDKKSYFWLMDGYLYLTDENVEAVNLVAYFEEAVILQGENCQCSDVPAGDSCHHRLDDEFRCPQYLLENAKRMVYDKLVKIYQPSRPDQTTDEKDDAR